MTTSPADFANWLLEALGDDPSTDSADVPVIEAWEAAEGGQWDNSAHYNPLNTTLPLDGSTVLSGGGAAAAAGVQAYSDWQDGLEATVNTLVDTKNAAGGQDYGDILTALSANDPAAAAQAIVNSPWGTKSVTYSGTTYTANGAAPTASTGSSSTTPATSSTTGGTESTALLSGAAGDVWKSVQPFLIEAMFAVGAIALLVVGAKQLVQPTLDKAAPAVKSVATKAGEAAL
jgi:hypothetical protein